MPFSGLDCILPVYNVIHEKCPNWQTYLDIGSGTGQWGWVQRTWFEFQDGNFDKKTWKRKIVGIEGFEAYRNPTWELYNYVAIGNAFDMLKEWPKGADPDPRNPFLPRYNLCTMIEVLEHFEKSQGIEMLKMLKDRCDHLIFSYTNSEQGAAFTNEFEVHRSTWTNEDILAIFPNAVMFYPTGVGEFWYVG